MPMTFPLIIIPAAGKGTRMGALCADGTPKALLEVNGKTIIQHVVDFWCPLVETNSYRGVVIVIAPEHKQAWRRQDMPPMPMVRYVVQPEPRGATDAVLCAIEEVRCPRHFAIALGDCLCGGTFDWSGLGDDYGVAVRKDDASEWGRSYYVGVYDDVSGVRYGKVVRSAIEKPALGLGFYFLNWQALPALERHRDDSMTAVIQELVEDGQVVRPVPFDGQYRNVTFPADLEGWPG